MRVGVSYERKGDLPLAAAPSSPIPCDDMITWAMVVVYLVVCPGLRLDEFLDEEDFNFGMQRNWMDWILPVHIALHWVSIVLVS